MPQQQFYKKLLYSAPFGYAYHKIITDDNGEAVDFVFLEVNSTFEKITGLKGKDIVQKPVTRVLPSIKNDEFNWISFYGNVAMNGSSREFEQFSLPLKRWYRGEVNSPEKGYFSVMFTDISKEKLIAKTTRFFLEKNDDDTTYEKLCDDVLNICNAKYAALNIFEENGKDFSTVAISGVKKNIRKVSSILGFELEGKKWPYDPVREKKIEGRMLSRFGRLRDFGGENIPLPISAAIEKTFGIGELVVVKIQKEEKVLGDFTIIMPRGVTLKNEGLVELFAGQVALILEKQKAQQELENFFDVNLDLLCIADMEGRFLKVNKIWSHVLGFSAKELEASNFLDFIHPDDLAATHEAMGQLADQSKVINFVNRYRTRSGDYRYIEWRSTPRGRLIYAAARDITERIDKEKELKNSELRFRSLFEQRNDAVFLADLNGKHFAVNNRASELLGYSERELLNMKIQELSAPDQPYLNVLQRLRKGEKVKPYEKKLLKKNGEMLMAEISAEIVFDASGKPLHAQRIVRDITEKKQTQVKLQESAKLLKKLSDQIPGVIYQYRYHPDGRSYFPFASSNLSQIYGVKPHQVREDASIVFERLHPDDKEKVTQSIMQSFHTLKKWENEYRVILPHRGGRWLQGMAKPEKLSDGSVLWHGFIHDITTRKRMENQLIEAKEQAQAASKMKSEFLANMSHEIRTPLNAILGFSEIMLNNTQNPKHINFLRNITKSGKALLYLINEILDLSRIEAGRMEIKPRPTDIRVLISEMEHMFAQSAAEKKLDFYAFVTPDVPQTLIIDEIRIRQILLNLIGNAVKFTHKGYVKAGVSLVSESEKEVLFSISVEDTGIGITEKDRERIFEAFTQQEGQSSRQYEGTGLGLTITKRLCKLMNGSITLQSEPGKGSLFTISLSAEKQQREKENSTAKPPVVVTENAAHSTQENEAIDIEVKKLFNSSFQEKLITHADIMLIDELLSLADEIEQFATEQKLKSLVELTDKLKYAVNDFDVKQIRENLKRIGAKFAV